MASFLRACEKPARMTLNSAAGGVSTGGAAWRRISTSAESTAGGGRNDLAGTRATISALA